MSMVVDVPTCSITWRRNGAVKAQDQFKQLQDTSIKWVPWMRLRYNGSSVSLLEETWA